MAYRYFTKDLLAKSNEIDLANIFAEKQQKAKEMLNTNYSLSEIVSWIKDNTNNFKKSENYFIDLDQAIKKLVYRYYESTNIANPFIYESEVEIEGYSQPRIPSTTGKADIKTKEEVEQVKEELIEQITESLESQIEGAIQSMKLMLEIDPDNEEYKESLMQLELTLETLK